MYLRSANPIIEADGFEREVKVPFKPQVSRVTISILGLDKFNIKYCPGRPSSQDPGRVHHVVLHAG